MTAGTFITATELVDLTGRQTRPAQIEALRAMGIEHRINADGRPVVLRAHLEQVLGAPADRLPKRRAAEPNFQTWN